MIFESTMRENTRGALATQTKMALAFVSLVLMLVCSCGVSTAWAAEAPVFDGGTGSEEDPYLISTADQMVALSDYWNNDGPGDLKGKAFKLTADIDLTGTNYQPLGNSEYNFATRKVDRTFIGAFDGDGHSVVVSLDYRIDDFDDEAFDQIGVFGFAGLHKSDIASDETTIKNLVVKGSIKGKQYLGGVCGKVGGNVTIRNCGNYATVIGTGSASNVGGIAGGCELVSQFPSNTTKPVVIEGCFNKGNLSVDFDNRGNASGSAFGGIIGYLAGSPDDSVVRSCYNTGDISSAGTLSQSGGIVGVACGGVTFEESEWWGSYWDASAWAIVKNCASLGTVPQGLHCAAILGSPTVKEMDKSDNAEMLSELEETVSIDHCYALELPLVSDGKASNVFEDLKYSDFYEIIGLNGLDDVDHCVVASDDLTNGKLAILLGDAFKQGSEQPILGWEADETAPELEYRLWNVPMNNWGDPSPYWAMLYADGTLVFSGEGDSANPINPGLKTKTPAWVADAGDDIKQVRFENTVYLGEINGFFANCNNLKTIENYPETAKQFANAFKNCTSLVTVPSSFNLKTNNMSSAFEGCTSLTTMPDVSALPYSLNLSSAFKGCTSLQQLSALPNGISGNSLYNCFANCSAITSIPAGYALPAQGRYGWSGFSITLAEGQEPVLTYCEDADYEALSQYPWADDNRILVSKSAVALVDMTAYASLEEAVAAAEPGSTITLLSDVTVMHKENASKNSAAIVLPADVTLDGAGYTIKADAFTQYCHVVGVNKTNATIKNVAIEGTGAATGKHCLNVWDGANVILENVTLKNAYAAGLVINNSAVVATGLTTEGNAWGGVNVDRGSQFTLVSGNLAEDIKIWSEDADEENGSTVTCPEGWEATEVTGENGAVTVVYAPAVPVTPVTPTPTPSTGGNGGGGVTTPPEEEIPEDDNPLAGPEMTVNTFDDLDGTESYFGDIKKVYEAGVMQGIGGTKLFGPNETTNRAQFITMLYRLNGSPSTTVTEKPFADVPVDSYCAEAVTWAKANDITTGYGDGTSFGATDKVTREQMATFLKRYADHMGYPTTVTGNLNQFVDQNEIHAWAKDSVAWASGAGIVKGYGTTGKFGPTDNTIRAHAAIMFARFMDNVIPAKADEAK